MFSAFRTLNTAQLLAPSRRGTRLSYPYEEFSDQIQAMKMVCKWEYTTRFGHVGNAQTSRAHNARVIEYFSDSYEDQHEAVQKAEVFLSIYDYIGRHAAWFLSKDLMEGWRSTCSLWIRLCSARFIMFSSSLTDRRGLIRKGFSPSQELSKELQTSDG